MTSGLQKLVEMRDALRRGRQEAAAPKPKFAACFKCGAPRFANTRGLVDGALRALCPSCKNARPPRAPAAPRARKPMPSDELVRWRA